MKDQTKLRFTVLQSRGAFFAKEDSGEMELNDALDYLITKHSTNRGKLEKVLLKFFTEMRNEEKRIHEEKVL